MKYLNKQNFMIFLASVPFIIFIIAKSLLCQAPASACPWSRPFYYAAVVALIVIALHFVAKISFNRFLLAINVWLISSATLFLINYEYLLLLMNTYKGPFFFVAFILTGLISILFLPGGFIDLKNVTEEKNQRFSLLLLAGCVVAFIWSLIFNSSGIALSIAFPFIALLILYVSLIKRA